jgi:hypothetical protein
MFPRVRASVACYHLRVTTLESLHSNTTSISKNQNVEPLDDLPPRSLSRHSVRRGCHYLLRATAYNFCSEL